MFKKIGILSLSIVTGAITAITTIIPLIANHYPEMSISRVETLVTISSLSAITTILLNNSLVKKIGLKKVIILGLVTGMVAGIIPYFYNNYYIFLLSRILLGIGVGMYSPHAISLISLFYTGNERASLLGIQMGIGAFGNSLLLVCSGWLASISWKYAFFTYLWLGIVAILVWRFVPSIKFHESNNVKSENKLPKSVLKYLVLCFATFLIIWGVQLKIPTFLFENGITSTEKSGLILSSMNIAGMFAGLSFGLIYKKIKTYLLPLGFIAAGLSVLSMINSSSWSLIFIFAIIFNFVYSFTGPTIVLELNQQASETQLPKINSMITLTTILSSYAAPVTWNSLSTIFYSKSDVAIDSLYIMTLSLFLVGVSLLIYIKYKTCRKKG